MFLTVHCALRCSRKDNREPTMHHLSFYSADFFFSFKLSIYFVLGTEAGIEYILSPKPNVITVIPVLLETTAVCVLGDGH